MNKKLKFGFSLFEAFVVMAIVGIFIALVANTISHRPKGKVASEAHGRFECYYEGGTLYQEMFTEKSSTGRVRRDDISHKDADGNYFCLFQPPSYVKYLIIDAVGGGAGGSAKGGGGEGQFVSSFYANVSKEYHIYPGKAGEKNTNGGKTIIYDIDGVEIVNAAGGKTSVDLENTTINDVLSCQIIEHASGENYDCEIEPACDITNGKIEVSFCRSSSSYVTRTLEYKKFKSDGTVDMRDTRYIVNENPRISHQKGADTPDTSDDAQDVWIYHDISLWSDLDESTPDPTPAGWVPKLDDMYTPSLYTMALVMDMHIPDDSGSKSNMMRFIESMKYDSAIKNANVGNGGGKNAKGNAGAALFLW